MLACADSMFCQEEGKKKIRLIQGIANGIDSCNGTRFAFGERTTFCSTRLHLIESILHLMQNLIPSHKSPFIIYILFLHEAMYEFVPLYGSMADIMMLE